MSASIPFLFRNLTPLSPEHHLDLGLQLGIDESVLGKTQVIPVCMGEFADAAAHYPIVFAQQAPHLPHVVVGLEAGCNSFINAGQWRERTYIPLYARCHPFTLHVTGNGTAAVCMDIQSPLLVPLHENDTAQPLFTFDSQAAPALAERTRWLQAQHASQLQTNAFCESLQEHGLFVPASADYLRGDGSPGLMQGFFGVNVQAYHALPDEVLADWVRKGWCDAVALHLASKRQWHWLASLL